MPLGLRYGINEGISVSENTGHGHQESIEVIVREIALFPEGVNVDFELRDLNGNRNKLSLSEDDKYDITPLCTLHLTKDPLRRRTGGLPGDDRVFLKFYAPREVKFGPRKMYD